MSCHVVNIQGDQNLPLNGTTTKRLCCHTWNRYLSFKTVCLRLVFINNLCLTLLGPNKQYFGKMTKFLAKQNRDILRMGLHVYCQPATSLPLDHSTRQTQPAFRIWVIDHVHASLGKMWDTKRWLCQVYGLNGPLSFKRLKRINISFVDLLSIHLYILIQTSVTNWILNL